MIKNAKIKLNKYKRINLTYTHNEFIKMDVFYFQIICDYLPTVNILLLPVHLNILKKFLLEIDKEKNE